ncbi:MAG: geranylgeranylglyceryl/heptaprenylglyceryl phosphate synthase, partial [Chloroflexota bacterium]
MNVYQSICTGKNEGRKQLAVLIDPDKTENSKLKQLSALAGDGKIDYFFVGGSLLVNNQLDSCIKLLKENSGIPVILFPGNTLQMSYRADAMLFLSLISG